MLKQIKDYSIIYLSMWRHFGFIDRITCEFRRKKTIDRYQPLKNMCQAKADSNTT